MDLKSTQKTRLILSSDITMLGTVAG